MKYQIMTLLSVLIAALDMSATEVVRTEHLTYYYPQFSDIELSLERMPQTGSKEVDFCCEAAFTGQRLKSFSHANVADDHVSGGKWYKGYSCRANTGAFVWYGDRWAFMQKKAFLSQKPACRMAFCQRLLIHQGRQCQVWEMMRKNRTRYRALCEKDGRLCLIESNKVVTLEFFIQCLTNDRITNAIYLDMGAGWNYAWYRDKQGNTREIFPESKKAPDFPYRTNWVTFLR